MTCTRGTEELSVTTGVGKQTKPPPSRIALKVGACGGDHDMMRVGKLLMDQGKGHFAYQNWSTGKQSLMGNPAS